jgi:4-diphosphocytidyl-2-C-methyl-D-erythritol kinase
MGGGLGGGSSDAATVLVALNRLWETGLGIEQLADLGLQLGADVPVFVHGHAAWGEGVGEELTPLDIPEEWYLVVIPPCHVSTRDVFSDPDLTRDSPRIKIADFLAGSRENSCVPVVTRRYPPVASAMEWLGRLGEPRLTGTGSALFVVFFSRQLADKALAQLPDELSGFVARGLNRSPLYSAVELQA